MVVNFRAREINRGARKLVRTPSYIYIYIYICFLNIFLFVNGVNVSELTTYTSVHLQIDCINQKGRRRRRRGRRRNCISIECMPGFNLFI